MSDDGELPMPGALQKTRSLPKLLIEEIKNENHPGHRYLTPQPSKHKPFLPPKPSGNSVRRISRQNGYHEDIAEDAESEEKPPPSQSVTKSSGLKTEHTHENERLEEAKRDLVASSGPLIPKRKAPGLPSNRRQRRRKSDTQALDIKQLQMTNSKDILSPSGLHASQSSDSSPTRHRYYTPQPKRKQFNPDRNKYFNDFDGIQGSTKSPVKRLADMYKRGGSSDSSDSTPSPGQLSFSSQFSSPSPTASPRSPSSYSAHSTTSGSPPSTSPKGLPISPLASSLKVTNLQNSPLSGITWQSSVCSDENRHRSGPRKPIQRSRPQSSPVGPFCYRNTKPLRKNGSSIRSHNAASGIRKGKHRSMPTPSTMTNLIKSPDRNVNPVQAFGEAYEAENAVTPRVSRRLSPALRDELFNSIILNKAENVTPMKVTSIPLQSPLSPVNEVPRTNNNTEHEDKSKIAHIARQKSRIDEKDGVFYKVEPSTPSSTNGQSSPSSGYVSSPSPTSSPRHRPKLLRHMSSVSSIKSVFGSREVLNDLFLSDRGTNRHLKAVAGFITGLILGVILFVGLYYGLKYGIIAAVVITALSTVLMSVCLAFTVRARCVALLMLPTLCTQRGRAAFLAIVVALLLNGPINNIFLNANEVSSSMSCSAELAYNQSQQIKDVAAEVFDQYVKNLENSVDKLKDLAEDVQGVFQPVTDGLDTLQSGLNAVKTEIENLFGNCAEIAEEAKQDCMEQTSDKIQKVYTDCQDKLRAALPGNVISGVCDIFSVAGTVTDTLCDGYKTGREVVCAIPNEINKGIDDGLKAISDITNQFSTDIDFMPYWDSRHNQSSTFEDIQQAVENEIQNTVSVVNYIFSVLDKLLTLSVVYLLYVSYQYHTHYRTRDNFDNFYITSRFKELDEKRKTKGKKTLLPLKKSERVRLIDVTSFRLSKPEKGLFRMGLAKLSAHVCIASLLIIIDNGLYYLLELIRKYGSVQVGISGESGLQFDIKGNSALSAFIQDVFGSGLNLDNSYNASFDTTQCLPSGAEPNHYLAVGIACAYFVVLIMTLFQAYVLRLRRHIAEYFYPERELERLYFLYNDTLRKRQTLFKFLKDVIKQKQKVNVATQKVSLRVFLTDRYPTLKKIFTCLRITTEPKICFGCDSDDDGTFKHCDGIKCTARYCDECLKVTNNVCSICGERFEDIYDTIDDNTNSESQV